VPVELRHTRNMAATKTRLALASQVEARAASPSPQLDKTQAFRSPAVWTSCTWPACFSFHIQAPTRLRIVTSSSTSSGLSPLNQIRPVGLAPDGVLTATGLPTFQPNNNQYEGRLRIQRANMAVSALPLLAALTPAEHKIKREQRAS
jgi:hypothetical protein